MPYYTSKDRFDPDEVNSPMIGLAFDNHPTTPGEHCHHKGQLLYCSQGVTHFFCQGRYFLLPPTKAAWIPPKLTHDVHSENKVSYRSLYIDVRQFLKLPETMQILQVEPLLKVMIEKFCSFNPGYAKDSPEYRLATVIVDSINQAVMLPLSLPRPVDTRLNTIFQAILQNPGEANSVNDYAKLVNVTSRTLNRITQRDIGMSFEKWRLALRLMHAFDLLERGYSVTKVSQCLGYSNDSSFIARFKQWAGETPAQYRRKVQSLLRD